jgi:hypothetical protein
MPYKEKNYGNNLSKRRQLLKFIGLGSAVLAGRSAFSQIRVTEVPGNIALQPQQANYISVKLLRPDDLLSLELRYYNFNFSGSQLQKKSNPAFLAVIFQPQAIAEQAWSETEGGFEAPTLPGKMLMGGESRLVFRIPDTISSVSLTLDDLLAWEKYELAVNERATQPVRVDRVATPVITPKVNEIRKVISARDVKIQNVQPARGLSKDEKLIANQLLIPAEQPLRREVIANVVPGLVTLIRDHVRRPDELETSLEVPMRLYLSPTKLAGWNHLKKISPDKGIINEANRLFELWHTRMGTKTNKGIDESDLTNEQRIVRALWADDADKDYKAVVNEKIPDSYLGNTSLSNKDRHRIVHESSNFQIPKFVPPPIKARKLFLTALGAWLTSEFMVDRTKLQAAGILQGSGNALNLLSWKHIATMGRDHYVEVVSAGNIFPFGHEAVLVKITERKPHPGTGTAANFQREFIIITEPVKDYNYRDGKGQFMNFCFSRVEFVTTTSPLLDSPKTAFVTPVSGSLTANNQFRIRSNNADVLFKMKAEDLDGNLVDFSVPLVYISTDAQDNGPNIQKITDTYNSSFSFQKKSTTNGQKFTLAPQTTNGCDTAFASDDITFGAMQYKDASEPQGYLPTLAMATITEPSYQRLTGTKQSVSVSLVDDKNEGHVFAKFNFSQPVKFDGQTDKTGGLAAPNFNLSGLSKAAGAFGGNIDKFKSATASADDFFKVSNLPDPKLFGVFKLSDILNFVSGDKSSYDLAKPLTDRKPKIPNLVTEETKDEIITSYVINPQINNIDLGFVAFVKKGGSQFSILTRVKVKKKMTAAPEFSTDAKLTAFKIAIMKGLINIDFNEIRFQTTAGKKADVSVLMASPPVAFGGPLEFINNFNSLIPTDGFSDPPYLEVTLAGIKCGFTQALPNLQMGVLSLSNITLRAEVNLPFTGAPLTFGFRFCERQQPFTLTVSFLGGGGFFGLELDLQGIRQIEASLEFGAAASINLGVASGGVSIMAGIYFKMTVQDGQNSTLLTGYVRINGALCILGLITASLVLYLALTYLIDKKKAFGEAVLKLKIEILFFSASVTLHAERTFAGSGSDPNLQMAIKENEWLEYCGAFAA